MSEAKLHFDTEPITALPSEEIIANPRVAWHAIRGYDFAGLEGMLQSGLLPTENQQDYSVSVSVSPEQAWSKGRKADSFCAYTLQDGISLAIERKWPFYPSGYHGGFVDESRLASVAPEAISGVLLPEEALNRPLTQLVTRHEARKPLQARQFIKRTLEHIQDLGGKLSDDANVLIEDCLATSASGQYLTAEQSLTLETSLMQAYSDALTDRLGIAQPTVSDALRVVFDRAKTKPSTYLYSAEQKREIRSRNTRIEVRNQARNLGQLTAADFSAALKNEDTYDVVAAAANINWSYGMPNNTGSSTGIGISEAGFVIGTPDEVLSSALTDISPVATTALTDPTKVLSEATKLGQNLDDATTYLTVNIPR